MKKSFIIALFSSVSLSLLSSKNCCASLETQDSAHPTIVQTIQNNFASWEKLDHIIEEMKDNFLNLQNGKNKIDITLTCKERKDNSILHSKEALKKYLIEKNFDESKKLFKQSLAYLPNSNAFYNLSLLEPDKEQEYLLLSCFWDVLNYEDSSANKSDKLTYFSSPITNKQATYFMKLSNKNKYILQSAFKKNGNRTPSGIISFYEAMVKVICNKLIIFKEDRKEFFYINYFKLSTDLCAYLCQAMEAAHDDKITFELLNTKVNSIFLTLDSFEDNEAKYQLKKTFNLGKNITAQTYLDLESYESVKALYILALDPKTPEELEAAFKQLKSLRPNSKVNYAIWKLFSKNKQGCQTFMSESSSLEYLRKAADIDKEPLACFDRYLLSKEGKIYLPNTTIFDYLLRASNTGIAEVIDELFLFSLKNHSLCKEKDKNYDDFLFLIFNDLRKITPEFLEKNLGLIESFCYKEFNKFLSRPTTNLKLVYDLSKFKGSVRLLLLQKKIESMQEENFPNSNINVKDLEENLSSQSKKAFNTLQLAFSFKENSNFEKSYSYFEQTLSLLDKSAVHNFEKRRIQEEMILLLQNDDFSMENKNEKIEELAQLSHRKDAYLATADYFLKLGDEALHEFYLRKSLDIGFDPRLDFDTCVFLLEYEINKLKKTFSQYFGARSDKEKRMYLDSIDKLSQEQFKSCLKSELYFNMLLQHNKLQGMDENYIKEYTQFSSKKINSIKNMATELVSLKTELMGDSLTSKSHPLEYTASKDAQTSDSYGISNEDLEEVLGVLNTKGTKQDVSNIKLKKNKTKKILSFQKKKNEEIAPSSSKSSSSKITSNTHTENELENTPNLTETPFAQEEVNPRKILFENFSIVFESKEAQKNYENETLEKREKIQTLFKDIILGENSIGKQKPLSGDLSTYWSARLNKKDRLVYKIEGNIIFIRSVSGHYDD